MHPTDPDTGEPFHWVKVDVSSAPMLKKQLGDGEWVTEAARQIGLGPVLYLFTMKALAYLFLVFGVINIPLYMFYSKGEGPLE